MTTTTHAILPPGFGRREVIALICEIGRRLGLSSSGTDVLTRIIGSTDARAWTDPMKEPMFWGRQETLAFRIGLCARQLRNHERTFARLGLIERRTMANGGRAGKAGMGLRLTPIIERFAELIALRDAARAQADRMKTLAALRSLRKRELADLVSNLAPEERDHPTVAAIGEQAAQWPRADALLSMGEDRLTAHVAAATDLCTTLTEWVSNRSVSSGQPEGIFRSFTEETQETSTVPRKRVVNRVLDTNDAPSRLSATPDDHVGSKRIDRAATNRAGHKTDKRPPLGMLDLVRMASDEFQFEIEARTGHRGRGLDHAIVDAAAARLTPLRIAPSAWEEACDVMGRARAAICVMLVDANRAHPSHPTRNPGGSLRSLTQGFRSGSLDLQGGLDALRRRTILKGQRETSDPRFSRRRLSVA